MKSALRFADVSFAYSPRFARTVLDGLSLEVPDGGVTTILGANGAGKTTLLALALGWLRPRTGGIELFGKDLHHQPKRLLGQTMALVPQYEYIPFQFTVTEYALLGRAPHLRPLAAPGAEDLHVTTESLRRVGLVELQERPVTELSAGERQLLLLARALSQEPRRLLLDEPSRHLDLPNRKRLLSVIRELVADGLTVALTTHDPQLAAAASDTVCLLKDGRLVAHGPPREIITTENLSATYGTPVSVEKLQGDPVVLWHRQGG